MKLEQERLQYTRIGILIFDLDRVFKNTLSQKDIISKTKDWIIWEYHAVKKLKNKKERFTVESTNNS